MKILLTFVFLLLLPISVFSTTFEEGEISFLNNKPVEAVLYFEKAISEEPYNEDIYMYLGLSYLQNNLHDKAISTFLNGALINGIQKGRFYLAAGNAYVSKNEPDKAKDLYNRIIEMNLSEKGKALLNRANIYMDKSEYNNAVSDYKNYLLEVPYSEQKEKILRLISLIENAILNEQLEAERLAAEAEKLRKEQEALEASEAAEAERRRLEEERRRADEAARQKALMDEILNSLSTISDDTQNIAADSETITHTDEDSDIDD